MKIKRFNDIKISYDSFYKFIILMFLIMLYAYYEKRIYVEIVFIVVFGHQFITKKKQLTLYTLWNLMFFGVCLISLLYSANVFSSLQMSRRILEVGILGTLLIAYLDNEEKVKFLIKSFVWAGIALVIRLLISFPISMWGAERLGDDILNANSIGLYLSISSIFAFYLAKANKQKNYYVFVIVFFAVIMLTGSRKAFVMVLMGISMLYYSYSKNLTNKFKAVIMIATILLVSYYLIMSIPDFYDILGSRMEMLINSLLGEGTVDNSTNLRESMINTGVKLFKNNPLLGSGLNTYSTISGFNMYSHNNYIELLVGLGLFGVIIYYSMYVYILIKLYSKKSSPYCNSLLVIIIMLSLVELGLVSYYGIIYQMIIALGFASIRVYKSVKNGCELSYDQ